MEPAGGVSQPAILLEPLSMFVKNIKSSFVTATPFLGTSHAHFQFNQNEPGTLSVTAP